MAMSNAERQARYRRHARKRTENYTARLNTEILSEAKMALKRLSLHNNLSQREVLEQIIIRTDEVLRQSLNDQEHDRYLALTLQPLRSRRKNNVTQ
ncbi:hypothetical protein OM226_15795 [Escherichia albertii]|nr:hypothetical protein [Escherichia albertii]MCZ8849440.1 hypothetical protein [Escherichia albertii]